MFKVELKIMPRKGILNPQAAAVKNGLGAMGYEAVEDLKMGKFMEFTLNISEEEKAKSYVEEMCKRLLANPVIEDYFYKITKVEGE